VVDTRMKKMKRDGGMEAAEEEWENWKPSPFLIKYFFNFE
jgi:hypothetical protein